MATNNLIHIEVVYATPAEQCLLALTVPVGTSIQSAIATSGILQKFPELELSSLRVGIFSKPRELADIVKEGDRIEIYRRLLIDPKEARRIKAKKK